MSAWPSPQVIATPKIVCYSHLSYRSLEVPSAPESVGDSKYSALTPDPESSNSADGTLSETPTLTTGDPSQSHESDKSDEVASDDGDKTTENTPVGHGPGLKVCKYADG